MRTILAAMAVVALFAAACSPKLEEGEVLEKKGDTFTIQLSKKIDQPIDRVWESLLTPEKLENYAEQYQQTKLVKAEGNVKVVDYRVLALGQVQAFTMELTMLPETKVVKLKTLDSTMAEIVGEYGLKATDDGAATIITYRATQKDKVKIPAPVSVQKTAIKDSFNNLVAGIKKGIEAEGAAAQQKAS